MTDSQVFKLCTQGLRLVATVSMWLTACWFAWCAKGAIVPFAGADTNATVVLTLLAGMQADVKIAYTAGVIGTAFGICQYFRARFVIRRYEGRNKKWEATVDINRSSSNLSRSGDTRAEDR